VAECPARPRSAVNGQLNVTLIAARPCSLLTRNQQAAFGQRLYAYVCVKLGTWK
jgi:hypothetical protein